MSERKTFEKPEDRIFLTADFSNFIELLHMRQDFDDKIHAVKLGMTFLGHDKSGLIRQKLHTAGFSTFLDVKLKEDPDQMGHAVNFLATDRYSYLSVAASSSPEALATAYNLSGQAKVVAALSVGQRAICGLELENIVAANELLLPDSQLERVMCNVSDIERVRRAGNFSIIATGVRMPGQSAHDQPAVMTPVEAVVAGADYLAVGRAVTAAPDSRRAMDEILGNLSQ